MRKQYQAVTAAEAVKVIKSGDNKKLDKGKIVSTFVMGSQKIYNFIDGNHEVLLKDVEYTNDPFIIAQQPKMTSINSAIQIDLSGQVCADSLGDKIYSGVGGQIDYVYGSSRAKLIISVAHPQFQEQLDEAAFKRFGSHFHYLWSHV